MKKLWGAVRRNRARTSPASTDLALRGQTYAIPFVQVWVAALALASQPRWQVTHFDENEGIIQAESTTRVFRFVDDVVIEISLDADGQTRVDMESRSRVGAFDLGTNRRRIRRFIAALDRAVDARPEKILEPSS